MKALHQCSNCSLQAIQLILLSVFTLSCVHVRLHVHAAQASLCADNITVVGNHWELQSNTLLSMRRNKSQSSNKEQFIVFKCKHCSKEFDSSRAYRCHRTSPEAQGTPCSLEQNKSEMTYTARSDLSTGVLRQRSLARLGALFKFCSIERDNLNTTRRKSQSKMLRISSIDSESKQRFLGGIGVVNSRSL